MGLRIREALGAEKRDFRTRKDGSHYLRLRSQATRDGKGRAPLKHRKEGQGRDIPVPDFIWNMVAAMPDGPLCPGPKGTPYLPYFTARGRFDTLTAAMGITGYTTHSLRHQFASEALDEGANIANIAAILGHRTVETTLRIYVHPTEDAEARMRDMMNDRWGTRKAAGQQGRLAARRRQPGRVLARGTRTPGQHARPAARPRPPGPRRQRPAPRPHGRHRHRPGQHGPAARNGARAVLTGQPPGPASQQQASRRRLRRERAKPRAERQVHGKDNGATRSFPDRGKPPKAAISPRTPLPPPWRSLRSRGKSSPQEKERYARPPQKTGDPHRAGNAPPRGWPRCPKPGHRGHYAIHRGKDHRRPHGG